MFYGSIHSIPYKRSGKAVKAFFEALDVTFEKKSDTTDKLPAHVIEGIAEGQADFEAGRTFTLSEFKKRLFKNK